MRLFTRCPENPILLPNRGESWESEAVFNGSAVKSGRGVHLLYRAMSAPTDVGNAMLEISSIGHAVSSDGVHFRERRLLIKPEYSWEKYGCEDPRVTRLDGVYYVFYTALASYPFTPDGIKVGVAITKDLNTIDAKYPVTMFNSKAMALFPEKIGNKIAAVLTAHTDKPPAKIALAFFNKEEDIWSRAYWEKWYAGLDAHALPLQRSSRDHVEVGAAPVKTKYGWLLIYSYIKDYLDGGRRVFGVEAALLDLKHPQNILARTYKPLLTPEEEYEKYGNVPNVVFPSGALVDKGNLSLYYGAADTTCCLATAKLSKLLEEFLYQLRAATFKRFNGNPIIAPRKDHPWESKATFNPAALCEGDTVHLLYRAMSADNISTFGYAASANGYAIDERLPNPVYVPRKEFETQKTANGNSGCEDPRLAWIGETIYMCYTAFNGVDPPRVALSTIPAADFFAKKWTWSLPVLISPPHIDDKDACLFPKKINGAWHVIHRIGSSIWLDTVERLNDLGVSRWLAGKILLQPRKDTWDSRKIGLAAPPIETRRGWLLLYHGVSDSNKYRVGAALLDLKNPSKVIGRRIDPVLAPEMDYERVGHVPNVVFPCGAARRGSRLIIYYGGADKVVGAADIDLRELVRSLAHPTAKKSK